MSQGMKGPLEVGKKNEHIFFFCIFLEEHSLADSLALGLLNSRDDKEPGN